MAARRGTAIYWGLAHRLCRTGSGVRRQSTHGARMLQMPHGGDVISQMRFLPRVLWAILVTGAIVVGAGLSGALFSTWPVSWPDQSLVVTPQAIAELQALRSERKFLPDPRILYPGAIIPERRLASELLVNDLIDTLFRDLPA